MMIHPIIIKVYFKVEDNHLIPSNCLNNNPQIRNLDIQILNMKKINYYNYKWSKIVYLIKKLNNKRDK